MNVYEIISTKRNNGRLSPDEIAFIISRFTADGIPDYQMAAFLMAVYFRGMDHDEISCLTRAMTESGDVIDLSDIPGVKVDKHSTGGVGDGVSLVLAPLAACAGLVVPMMSGRALGHTGGTLDKLESIPGFRTSLSTDEYRQLLRRIGVAMIGQTATVAPADKKMYALRDVTATVDSIPLIAASIMSKKLAEGCDALVLDVKCGSGAFMKTQAEARTLAATMVAIGNKCGKKVTAFITDMDQPLGRAVGNALEVKQAIEVLKGRGPADFIELTLALAARMLVVGGIAGNNDTARTILLQCIRSGSALMHFEKMVEAQGGDPRVVDTPDTVLAVAPKETVVLSVRTGYVRAIDTQAVGMAAIALGAGRRKQDDRIDYGAGIIVEKKRGERVVAGEPLARLFSAATTDVSEAMAKIAGAYTIGDERPDPLPLIHAELD
jgi:pyrimidine-nucleoside phosphorylase